MNKQNGSITDTAANTSQSRFNGKYNMFQLKYQKFMNVQNFCLSCYIYLLFNNS